LLTLPEELEGSRTVDQEREVWSIFIYAFFETSFCDLLEQKGLAQAQANAFVL